jgi:hypothetical protein
MCLDLLVAFGLEQSVEALHHRTNPTNGVADSRRSTCDFQFRAYNNGRGSSMEGEAGSGIFSMHQPAVAQGAAR